MDSAYIKALKEKHKQSLAKAKEREKLKLNTLYKDLAVAIVQKTHKESEFKRLCSDDELIAKALSPLLEMYPSQDLQDKTPNKGDKE